MSPRLFPLILMATIVVLTGCSDSSDTGYKATPAQSEQVRRAQIFPYTHNPQRLAKIGADACVKCHEKAVNDWKQSHHAKANRPISSKRDSDAFIPTRHIQESGVTYELAKEGEQFKLRVLQDDGSSEEYDLVGVIGETPLRQYLAHLPGKRFQTISATYDVINDQWVDVYEGEDRMPGEWGHWAGQGMNWNANCAYCHTTEYQKGFDYEKNVYESTWVQQGLACAECHTGLEAHVNAAHGGDYTTGLTKLTKIQTEHNCATCHSRRDQLTADAFMPGDSFHDHFSLSLPDQAGLYHADGQILDEVFVYASFQMSRMSHKGISCMDCHNPHSMEPILPIENNMLCMRCHEAGVQEAPIIEPLKHSFHAEGSTGNQCVQCHMRKTTYMQVDPRADHGFHSPDPLMTRELGIPNACSQCHTDQSLDWAIEHSENWYGEKLAQSRQRARARAVSLAYNYAPEALPALLKLDKEEDIPAWRAIYTGLISNDLPNATAEAHLKTLLDHPSPYVRERAVNGLARSESGPEVALNLLKDEIRSVRIAAARALATGNQAIPDPRASQDLTNYLAFNADRPQSLLIQANTAAHAGRSEEAQALIERAISLDAANPEMYHQAAILLSSAGLNKEARSKLFAGWELAPKEPRFPYSLGLLAAEAGDLESAVGYLEETVAMEPRFYRAWYNLSLAYSKLNRIEDAQRAMHKAQGQ